MRRRWSCVACLTTLVLVVCVSVLAAQPPPKDDEDLRVNFLNIGHGTCTLIECPGDPAQTSPILYDCGSSATGTGMDLPATEQYLDELLGRYGRPPIVLVSHPDRDHYNRIPGVLDYSPAGGAQNVAGVWLGGNRLSYTEANFQLWLANQTQAGAFVVDDLPMGWHNDGNVIDALACGDASTRVLTVNATNHPAVEPNAASLVLRIQYDDTSVTLTGDATAETLASVMDNYRAALAAGLLATTVLGVPHHGSESHGSSNPVWASVFQPEIAVYSAGNSYSHPRCSPMLNYHNQAPLLATDQHGLRCGEVLNGNLEYVPFNYGSAQYLTRTNGSISVVSDGSDIGLDVFCDADNCMRTP